MKFSRILCAIFFIVVLHLTLFVSGLAVRRSLSDDIRNGISIAGKILGVDSPSNIAMVSNIAELVSRAFSTNTNTNLNQQNGWDRRQMSGRYPTEHLEDFDDVPQQTYQTHSNEQGSIDDNVIIGNNINTKPTISATDGFFGQVLRILGMDTSKIGALAVNGIIFIAQMIGKSLMSAFTGMRNRMGTKPNENIDVTDRTRRFKEDVTAEEAQSIWDDTIGWVRQQRKSSPFLLQHIDTMLDENLPERLVNLVDNGNDRDETNKNTDCIKQLLCKTAPFIWSMQKAVSAQLNKPDTDTNTSDHASDKAKNVSPDDNNIRMNAFFKHLPSVDEFKNHGVLCEDDYKDCRIF